MSTYGLTPQGFVRKPADQIKADLEADLRTAFGNSINLAPESMFGQLVGLSTGWFDSLWQLLEAVYASRYPDSASGASLVGVCAITGTVQEVPTYSTVIVTASGTAGAVVPSGTRFSVKNGAQFTSTADATIGQGGTVAIACTAVEVGPNIAPAGTLTQIDTPVAGLSGVTNPLDAVPGRGVESDQHLRSRREEELRSQGLAAVEAVRDRMLGVAGVTSCFVFENPTDFTNADGLPPHSIEVLVLGGLDADVALQLWRSKGDGIQTHGRTTVQLKDSQGFPQQVSFSRPDRVLIWVDVVVQRGPNVTPGTLVSQVQETLIDLVQGRTPGFAGFGIGDTIVKSRLAAALFGISGLVDVVHFALSDTGDDEVTGNITLGPRQLAVFDTSRIRVTEQ